MCEANLPCALGVGQHTTSRSRVGINQYISLILFMENPSLLLYENTSQPLSIIQKCCLGIRHHLPDESNCFEVYVI